MTSIFVATIPTPLEALLQSNIRLCSLSEISTLRLGILGKPEQHQYIIGPGLDKPLTYTYRPNEQSTTMIEKIRAFPHYDELYLNGELGHFRIHLYRTPEHMPGKAYQLVSRTDIEERMHYVLRQRGLTRD